MRRAAGVLAAIIVAVAGVVGLIAFFSGRDSAPVSAYKPEPHFFCQRCESEQFKLFSSGIVHCGHCGARMRNLSVTDTPNSQSTEH